MRKRFDKLMLLEHPMQPVFTNDDGYKAFKENAIVRHLLETHPTLSLDSIIANTIYSASDKNQFAQLVGKACDGFGEIRQDTETSCGRRHPMQPIWFDEQGTTRFKKNRIVDTLLWTHPTVDMNTILSGNFCIYDRNQFAQLVGYSVSGFGGLSFADAAIVEEADAIADQLALKQICHLQIPRD